MENENNELYLINRKVITIMFFIWFILFIGHIITGWH